MIYLLCGNYYVVYLEGKKQIDLWSTPKLGWKISRDYNPKMIYRPQQNISEPDAHMDHRWIPHLLGSLKINVYGAIGLLYAATTIVRDSIRRFTQGGLKDLKPCNLEEDEIMTFYLGLKLEDDLHYTPILIESDSSMIVKLINDKNTHIPWRIQNINIRLSPPW